MNALLAASTLLVIAILAAIGFGPSLAERLRGRDPRRRRREARRIPVHDPGRERRAERRARELMRSVVTADDYAMYEEHGFIRLPLGDWGLPDYATVEVFDLISMERYYWRGEWIYVRLDPQARVGHVLQVRVESLPPQDDAPLPLRG